MVMSTKSEFEQLIEKLESGSVSGDGYWCEDHSTGCGRHCPNRRWGKYGAAGVLFVHRETQRFFLTQRSAAIHHGGTWSVPGGAIDRNETPEEGARREVEEELGMGFDGRTVTEYADVVSADWAYTTVVVEVDTLETPTRFDWETTGCGWFTIQEMSTMALHPAFRGSFWKVVSAWLTA